MNFEELDYRPTPIGAISLRRRRDLRGGADIFEIKLGDAYLMSSLFTVSEVALARLGIGLLSGTGLDVVVGGLGLGYTAHAVLECESVGSLIVVEMLEPVIEWHRDGLLPLGAALTRDPRCSFAHGDFFALAASEHGFDSRKPGRLFDAILLDIDHTPEMLLDEGHARFYRVDGLRQFAKHLHPGGVFALWSNETTDPAFVARLRDVFADAWGEPVTFHNPLQNQSATQTVYLARRARTIETAIS